MRNKNTAWFQSNINGTAQIEYNSSVNGEFELLNKNRINLKRKHLYIHKRVTSKYVFATDNRTMDEVPSKKKIRKIIRNIEDNTLDIIKYGPRLIRKNKPQINDVYIEQSNKVILRKFPTKTNTLSKVEYAKITDKPLKLLRRYHQSIPRKRRSQCVSPNRNIFEMIDNTTEQCVKSDLLQDLSPCRIRFELRIIKHLQVSLNRSEQFDIKSSI